MPFFVNIVVACHSSWFDYSHGVVVVVVVVVGVGGGGGGGRGYCGESCCYTTW